MTGVFVNYRSRDEVFAVPLFDKRLTEVFGAKRVFVDHRSLQPGEDFRPPLWRQLESCTVLLALIGGRWLELTDLDGTPLLHREDDFVRREIREALRLKKTIIPVLLAGARWLTEADLPDDIADLASHQYITVDRQDIDHDIERVVAAVREHVPVDDSGSGPASTSPIPGGNHIGINNGQATQGPYSHAVGHVWGDVIGRRDG